MKKPKRWSPEWWDQIKTMEELIKALLEPIHKNDEEDEPKEEKEAKTDEKEA